MIGRRQYAQDKANEMAERGYAAFALDMYGKGVFGRDGDAEYNTSLMSPLAGDRAKLRKRVRAAEAGRAQPKLMRLEWPRSGTVLVACVCLNWLETELM